MYLVPTYSFNREHTRDYNISSLLDVCRLIRYCKDMLFMALTDMNTSLRRTPCLLLMTSVRPTRTWVIKQCCRCVVGAMVFPISLPVSPAVYHRSLVLSIAHLPRPHVVTCVISVPLPSSMSQSSLAQLSSRTPHFSPSACIGCDSFGDQSGCASVLAVAAARQRRMMLPSERAKHGT